MMEDKPENRMGQESSLRESVCDITYLTEMMSGKKHLILQMMEGFLKQIPEELECMNNAVLETDFTVIKSIAHSMKSSVSIMDISILVPVLQEMEELGTKAINIERIVELNQKLNLICMQAVEEIEKQQANYI
jgi:HPt (histidine-containing phosphotransfer) domain-containing protein